MERTLERIPWHMFFMLQASRIIMFILAYLFHIFSLSFAPDSTCAASFPQTMRAQSG